MEFAGAKIKNYLEETFDIPFHVVQAHEGHELSFLVGPANSSKEFFELHIYIRNQVRLLIDFIPQRYAFNFIFAMGNKPLESRLKFSNYINLMIQKGAKLSIKVNGQDLEWNSPDSWPINWESFEARTTIFPVEIGGEHSSIDLIMKWGSLMMGMVLSLADIVPLTSDVQVDGYEDGALRRVEVNQFERNPLNRKLCIEAKGLSCNICGINFGEKYGAIGHNYIHVHHIIPLSYIREGYMINPLNDLIPVCPNCHAMFHRRNPPFNPEELKSILDQQHEYVLSKSITSFVADSKVENKISEDTTDKNQQS